MQHNKTIKHSQLRLFSGLLNSYPKVLCAIALLGAMNVQAAEYFGGWETGQRFDAGFTQPVALYGSTMVEVHNGHVEAGPLWFSVSPKEGGDTSVSYSAQQYEIGCDPSIDLYGLMVVDVHNNGGDGSDRSGFGSAK
jgi:hypothetical protein